MLYYIHTQHRTEQYECLTEHYGGVQNAYSCTAEEFDAFFILLLRVVVVSARARAYASLCRWHMP